MAFVAGNGEIAAADDRGVLERMARALDFLRVARVELQLAHGAVSLDELHADDAGASLENELLDQRGFVHGKKVDGGLAPCDHYGAALGGACKPPDALALLIGQGARQVLGAAVASRIVLDALSVGLVIVWRLRTCDEGPAQHCEHARKHGKGSEGLHGKGANWLTIPSQPALKAVS